MLGNGDFITLCILVCLFVRLLGNCSCVALLQTIYGLMRCDNSYIAHYAPVVPHLENELRHNAQAISSFFLKNPFVVDFTKRCYNVQ